MHFSQKRYFKSTNSIAAIKAKHLLDGSGRGAKFRSATADARFHICTELCLLNEYEHGDDKVDVNGDFCVL